VILIEKTLQCLREMINERTEYRSGPKLVQFFNSLGFSDVYGQSFPSRWVYTDQRLAQLNGTPNLDQCIKETFAPINFIGRLDVLDELIGDFNQYLAFDKWKLIRDGANVGFVKLDKVELVEPQPSIKEEDLFLGRTFKNISFSGIGLDDRVNAILAQRLAEVEKCFSNGAYLAAIFLAGSTLEGLFLGLASGNPKLFNGSRSAPRATDGQVKRFQDWALSSFIDVSRDLGLIEYDTHKFSHELRDFRNYIHPFQQMASGFAPREHTAKISLQVLLAAVEDVRINIKRLNF
jgi:hypothetical protein